VPLLTVPTPMGKCVIGPWEELVDHGGYYLLHTKDGVPVEYTTGEWYDPREGRRAIPAGTVGLSIGGRYQNHAAKCRKQEGQAVPADATSPRTE
jgi:hypothetical protein